MITNSIVGLMILLAGANVNPKVAATPSQISNNQPKLIALTFDDGPDATLTPQVLATLKKYCARATFFVTGQAARANPQIVMRATDDGNEIGNHSYDHPDFTQLPDKKILEQITRTQKIIDPLASVCLLRPPGGAHNNRVDRDIETCGLKTITWTLDTHDYKNPPVDTLATKVVAAVRPNDIVLMHDIHKNTALALESIIIDLQTMGFKLVTVSELLAAKVQLPPIRQL